MIDSLSFKIGSLLDKPTGTSEVYSFDGPVKFEDIAVKSNISGKAEIMRIEEGLNVAVRNSEIKVQFRCERCLKLFTTTVKIKFFEKQFLLRRPSFVEDINDLYLINEKRMTIDLKEALRQEIILHFPINQVCSFRCKGLCPHCGKDRNKRICNCEDEALEQNEIKPFSSLKNLLK